MTTRETPIPPDLLRVEAIALDLLKRDKLEEAEVLLATLCNDHPEYAKFHFNHALVLYHLKDYKAALLSMERGLSLHPDDGKALRFKKEITSKLDKQEMPAGEIDTTSVGDLGKRNENIAKHGKRINEGDAIDTGETITSTMKPIVLDPAVKTDETGGGHHLTDIRTLLGGSGGTGMDHRDHQDHLDPQDQKLDMPSTTNGVIKDSGPKQSMPRTGSISTKLLTFHSLQELAVYKKSIKQFICRYVDRKWKEEEPRVLLDRENEEGDGDPHPDIVRIGGNPEIVENTGLTATILTRDQDRLGRSAGTRKKQVDSGLIADWKNELQDARPFTSRNPGTRYQSVNGRGMGTNEQDLAIQRVNQDQVEQIKKSEVITPRTAAENRKLLEKYTKIVHVNRDIAPIDREALINKQSNFDDEIVNSTIISTPIKPYHDLGTIDDARPRSDGSGMNGRENLVGVIDVERELNLEPRRREEPSQPSRKKILQLQPEAIERITAEITALPDVEEDECEEGKDHYIKNMLTKYKRMAKVLYDNAEYAGALALYQAILQVDPEDFESLFTQGFAYRELEEYENAISSFKRILELFYDNGYAWYCLAVVYALLNKGAEELYCLKKAKQFGYDVDIPRLSRLALTYIAKNPF